MKKEQKSNFSYQSARFELVHLLDLLERIKRGQVLPNSEYEKTVQAMVQELFAEIIEFLSK